MKKKLIIAGRSSKESIEYIDSIERIIQDTSNVILQSDGIPEKDIPLLFHSVDYVIFNYRDILTSGAVEVAESYSSKIIIPKLGCLREIKENNRCIKFKDRMDLTKILKNI